MATYGIGPGISDTYKSMRIHFGHVIRMACINEKWGPHGPNSHVLNIRSTLRIPKWLRLELEEKKNGEGVLFF